ncbi:MAG: hypothetical protein WBB28_01740 [Crinalium sp.]
MINSDSLLCQAELLGVTLAISAGKIPPSAKGAWDAQNPWVKRAEDGKFGAGQGKKEEEPKEEETPENYQKKILSALNDLKFSSPEGQEFAADLKKTILLSNKKTTSKMLQSLNKQAESSDLSKEVLGKDAASTRLKRVGEHIKGLVGDTAVLTMAATASVMESLAEKSAGKDLKTIDETLAEFRKNNAARRERRHAKYKEIGDAVSASVSSWLKKTEAQRAANQKAVNERQEKIRADLAKNIEKAAIARGEKPPKSSKPEKKAGEPAKSNLSNWAKNHQKVSAAAMPVMRDLDDIDNIVPILKSKLAGLPDIDIDAVYRAMESPQFSSIYKQTLEDLFQ